MCRFYETTYIEVKLCPCLCAYCMKAYKDTDTYKSLVKLISEEDRGE
jgi:hypothetical protein